MAWDPDNRGGLKEGLPDVGEVIKKARDSLGLGKGGKYLWLIVIVIILAVIFVYTAVYTIPHGHRGVVLRFGEFSGLVLPGLHLRIHFGVEVVYKVHTERVDTEAFGFRTGPSMRRAA